MLKQKPAFCVVTLLMTLSILPALILNAQDYRVSGSQRAAVEGTSNNNSRSNNYYRTPKVSKSNESAAEQRINEAHIANERGNNFFDNQDWANAVVAYQEAANKNPGSKVIQKNLAMAQEELLKEQQYQQWQQQKNQQRNEWNKIAVSKMQQAVQNFTQTINNVPITGDLQFGDPNVAVVINLPSTLPKAIEDAMAGVYKNAPAGVSERVRKGFQAVMTKDWKVARVWFQEALNIDPDNEGLKKFIVLCDYTPGTKLVNTPISEKIPVPAIFTYVPTSEEIKAYWENGKVMKEFENQVPLPLLPNEASAFSDQFRKYVYALNAEDSKKFDAFCEYTAGSKQDKNLPIQKAPLPITSTYVPTDDEREAFQENHRRTSDQGFLFAPMTSPPDGFSEKFKTYIMSLNEKEMEKFVSIQLPRDEDVQFLFPMELPLTTAEKLKSKVFGYFK